MVPTPPAGDLGMGDGSDVISFGDSWMNRGDGTGIAPSLDRASGRSHRQYGVSGTTVLSEEIPSQWEDAVADNPDIKTVIVTGGGNDILDSGCLDVACNPLVDDVMARFEIMIDDMAAVGVQDIVWIGYAYPPVLIYNNVIDYAIVKTKEICKPDNTPRCHFMDSTKIPLVHADFIHPDEAGYDILGDKVWELMQAEGMRR